MEIRFQPVASLQAARGESSDGAPVQPGDDKRARKESRVRGGLSTARQNDPADAKGKRQGAANKPNREPNLWNASSSNF
jgi:hypothetical protein